MLCKLCCSNEVQTKDIDCICQECAKKLFEENTELKDKIEHLESIEIHL